MNDQIKKFMQYFKYEGLTFDDVLLEPKYSEILPTETNITSQFSRNISLKSPFVSAAMDTVTESTMAIALANMGGIGVIHKNLSIEDQTKKVKKVKKHVNGLVSKPISFYETQSMQEIINEQQVQKYKFSTFPILDKNNHFKGMIFRADIKYCNDLSMTVKDCMRTNIVTGDSTLDMENALKLMFKHKVNTIPILENSNLKGLYCYHDLIDIENSNQHVKNLDSKYRLVVAAAISPYDYERADSLVKAGVDALVIDTSHGHSKGVVDTIIELKKKYSVDVIAGNIATEQAAKDLLRAGVDAVKVGIGPGSICTTRVVTGVGVPQLSAIYNTYLGTQGKIPIIADGGIKYSGDMVKALAVGANSLMMGSLLAGTDESPGEKIYRQGKSYVVYRGMGSLEAMRSGVGSRERYSQKGIDDKDLVPQGVEGLLAYSGSVYDSLTQFSGGIQFCLGYHGCNNIQEFKEKAKFLRISGPSLREAHPHQIQMTKDAPNYKSF